MAEGRTLSNDTVQASAGLNGSLAEPAPYSLNEKGPVLAASVRQLFIVLVDDNPADVLLVREALTSHQVKADLTIVRDGDEAIALLEEIDAQLVPCPDLMVLDLNLPRKTGFEVLERMRMSTRSGHIPVAILSSSAAPSDVQKAEHLGASRYFQKPSNLRDFMSIGARLREMLRPFAN